MWYWICSAEKDNGHYSEIGFNCKECYSFRLYAILILYFRKLNSDKNVHWFMREDDEHCDRDYKNHQCPECNNLMSRREIDDTWDWAGPHCNKCGCTGLRMFSHITRFKPVISGREIINVLERFVKSSK